VRGARIAAAEPTALVRGRIQHLLAELRTDLDADVAALLETDGDSFLCVAVEGDGAALGCITGHRVSRADEQLAAGVWVAVPGTRAFVVCASVAIDIDLSARPRALVAATADACIPLLARDAASSLDLVDDDAATRVRRVLDDELFLTVYQPIVDTRTGAVMAAEALTRIPAEPAQPTDQWFAEAAATGLGPALEVAAFSQAVRDIAQLPAGTLLMVNVSTPVAASRAFRTALEDAGADVLPRLVLELHTDPDRAARDDRLARHLDRVRTHGLKLAIEALRDGVVDLARLATLAPEFVKLDPSISADIDGCGRTRTEVEWVVDLAHRAGAVTIAQHVDRVTQLDSFVDVGVDWCQGFHLGRPAHITSLGQP